MFTISSYAAAAGYCEKHSDEGQTKKLDHLDCFASLAMTTENEPLRSE